MKKLIKNVYAGISAEFNRANNRYQFNVDFEQNSKEDIIQFLEPYHFDSNIDDNIHWFGYKYNEGIKDDKLRKEFIEFMKNVQEGSDFNIEEDAALPEKYSPFYLTEDDLNIMLIRSLKGIGLSQYNIDTVVYPGSSGAHNLVKVMIKCIKEYLRTSDKITYSELSKLAAKDITVDRKQFVQDLYNNEPALQGMTIDTIYQLSQDLEDLGDTLFSMRSHIHPKALRKYVKNIFAIESAEKLATAHNVLVVDDFKTTGTTIRDIIDQIHKCNSNPDLEIYVFTLMGNFQR